MNLINLIDKGFLYLEPLPQVLFQEVTEKGVFEYVNSVPESIDLKNEINLLSTTKRTRSNYGDSLSDRGLIDVFNPDISQFAGAVFNRKFLELCESIEKELCASLPSTKIYFSHSNLYYYDSVVTPRCLHRDSLRPHFKLFIPLIDVDNLSCGPYAYVPGSNKKLKRANIKHYLRFFYKKSHYLDANTTKISPKDPIILYAKRGQSFITDQRGIHGDLPALNNSKKIVLVANFKCN